MNKDIEFLKDLQDELKSQETDHQAEPRFWTVGDYRMVSCAEGEQDDYQLNCPNRDFYDKVDDVLESIKNDYLTHLSIEAQDDFKDISCEETALDWVKDYFDDDAYIVPIRKEHFIRPNTMFLTKADAKKHIELNHYHYTSKAHTYAMTAWRSPKVERLLKVLESFDWDSITEKEKK